MAFVQVMLTMNGSTSGSTPINDFSSWYLWPCAIGALIFAWEYSSQNFVFKGWALLTVVAYILFISLLYGKPSLYTWATVFMALVVVNT